MQLTAQDKKNIWLFSSEKEGITTVEHVTKPKVIEMIAESKSQKEARFYPADALIGESAESTAKKDMIRTGHDIGFLEGGKVNTAAQNPGAHCRMGHYFNADGIYVSKGWRSRKCSNEGYNA